MGLRINTNVSALNAARVLKRSTLDLNKSLERLSSGLRINRAADDAAAAKWHRASALPPLAFDHAAIVAEALARLRSACG